MSAWAGNVGGQDGDGQVPAHVVSSATFSSTPAVPLSSLSLWLAGVPSDLTGLRMVGNGQLEAVEGHSTTDYQIKQF